MNKHDAAFDLTYASYAYDDASNELYAMPWRMERVYLVRFPADEFDAECFQVRRLSDDKALGAAECEVKDALSNARYCLMNLTRRDDAIPLVYRG